MLEFPASARVACWLNAWLTGRESADEVIAGLLGDATRVDFAAPTSAGLLSPALVLGQLRRLEVRRVSACLPLPGHPLGLGGPAPFNADALEAEEALIWQGAELGFVPSRVGTSLTWRGSAANPPTYLPDVATADRDLRAALIAATAELTELDVPGWNPEVADALLNLHAPRRPGPRLPFVSASAARTATTGRRCAAIVELAGTDDGGALSAGDIAARRRALVPLGVAARAAVVAACSMLE